MLLRRSLGFLCECATLMYKQCCRSGSGIRCFCDNWIRIRDPGWKKIQSHNPGWTSRILVLSFLGWKYLNSFMRIFQNPGYRGSCQLWIWDPGWEKSDPGSWIRDKHPGSWIRDKHTGSWIRDKHPGSWIRDKHPGSATLCIHMRKIQMWKLIIWCISCSLSCVCTVFSTRSKKHLLVRYLHYFGGKIHTRIYPVPNP